MKIKGTPSLPLGQGCFTQIHPVHPVQVPLVHPTSIPVGLTDTLIICLAVALASIDLLSQVFQFPHCFVTGGHPYSSHSRSNSDIFNNIHNAL